MKHQLRAIISNLFIALFIILFVYTATSKLYELPAFRLVLSKSPLIGEMAPVLAVFIPAAELMIAFLLAYDKTQRIGLFGFLTLMIVFTVYIVYMLAAAPYLPCSCGGIITALSWEQHLLFNLLFIILSLMAINMQLKRKLFMPSGPVPSQSQNHCAITGVAENLQTE